MRDQVESGISSWAYLRGGTRAAPPIVQEIFRSKYILWRQQWTATAAEQRHDTATATLSSCSSVKFPNVYTVLTIRNAARNDVRV